jgi:hypothetical protein
MPDAINQRAMERVQRLREAMRATARAEALLRAGGRAAHPLREAFATLAGNNRDTGASTLDAPPAALPLLP